MLVYVKNSEILAYESILFEKSYKYFIEGLFSLPFDCIIKTASENMFNKQ